jgi:hypothetical protein
MKRVAGILAAGLVVGMALAPHAYAQTTASKAANSAQRQTTAPWYERFTFGSETAQGAPNWVPRSEPKVSLLLSPKSRWGLTVGPPAQTSRYLQSAPATSASAGAFYQVTPQLRVGGGVTLPTEQFTPGGRTERQEREPGVKLESSLKF